MTFRLYIDEDSMSQKVGYVIVAVMPDGDGQGKPDIDMA